MRSNLEKNFLEHRGRHSQHLQFFPKCLKRVRFYPTTPDPCPLHVLGLAILWTYQVGWVFTGQWRRWLGWVWGVQPPSEEMVGALGFTRGQWPELKTTSSHLATAMPSTSSMSHSIERLKQTGPVPRLEDLWSPPFFLHFGSFLRSEHLTGWWFQIFFCSTFTWDPPVPLTSAKKQA